VMYLVSRRRLALLVSEVTGQSKTERRLKTSSLYFVLRILNFCFFPFVTFVIILTAPSSVTRYVSSSRGSVVG
jgi:hypothetical protein